jgi:Holliday junction DNA helicase RuvA
MYEFIRGTIIERNPANIIIETAGVGYFINISLNTYSKLGPKREEILFLHQVVREDAHVLYGFADKDERTLFRNLISVNGVGANNPERCKRYRG